MIYLVVIWAILIAVGFVVGGGISELLQARFFSRSGDDFIYNTWLGLLCLAMLFLLLSLVVPLTFGLGVLVMVVSTGAACVLRVNRQRLATAFRAVLALNWLAVLGLMTGIAAFNAKHITLIDAGGYHIPLINWLSTYGASFGLGLLHPRYGYTSSWLALFAPLNAGVFENRMMSVPGGLALLLFFIHVCIITRRILLGDAKKSDFFILVSSAILFACITIDTGKFQGGFFRSTSPDVPVFILLPFIAWLVLVITEQQKGFQKQHITALVLLCAALVNVKLSAVSVVIIAALTLLLMRPFDAKFAAKLSLVGGLFLIPSIAYATVSTGCPLYPFPICLNTAWSLGTTQASAESEVIRIWARWGWWHGPSESMALRDQITLWAKGEWLANWFLQVNLAIAALFILGFIVPKWRHRSNTKFDANLFITICMLTSLLFWAYSAPTLRFGLGTLVILPALLLATIMNMGRIQHPEQFHRYTHSSLPMFVFTSLIGAIFFIQGITTKPNNPDALIENAMHRGEIPQEQVTKWLLPPKITNGVIAYRPQIRQTQYLSQKLYYFDVNNVHYSSPIPDTEDGTAINQCWAIDLMCSTRLGNPNIQLRDPARGVGAGFVRK